MLTLRTKNGRSWRNNSNRAALKPSNAWENLAEIGAKRIANRKESASLTSCCTGSVPASIAELARALKNDVDLIYEWIYSNIEYYPLWGLHKGAFGVLLDKIGGPFEQAALMVALLTEAGYTANFVYGTIRLSSTQLEQLLGTNDSTVHTSTANVLTASQIPFEAAYMSGNLVSADLSHVWVSVDISGTNYVFDPCLKNYSYITGSIDMSTAVDFDYSALRSAAGGTSGSGYIEDFDVAAVENLFATYGSNLLATIQSDAFDADMNAAIGGRVIQPLTGTPLRQTSLPYQAPGSTTDSWSAIPDSYKATLAINFETIDETLNSDCIYGKRLTITLNGSNYPELRVEGCLIATGTAALTPGEPYPANLSITHPFATTDMDESWQNFLIAGGTYVIGNSWGVTSGSMADYHRQQLNQNIANGGSSGDEDVLGESLAINWYMRRAQSDQIDSIYDQLGTAQHIWYHFAGISGYNSTQQGPYFDIGASSFDVVSRVGNSSIEARILAATEIVSDGYQAGIFQQNLDVTGINTMQMMRAAASQPIWQATSTNWNPFSGTKVRDELTNWDNFLDVMQSQIDAGSTLIIHQDGNTTVDEFVGGGWYEITTTGVVYGYVQGQLTPPISVERSAAVRTRCFWETIETPFGLNSDCTVQTYPARKRYWGFCWADDPPTWLSTPDLPCGTADFEDVLPPSTATMNLYPTYLYLTALRPLGIMILTPIMMVGGSTGQPVTEEKNNKGAQKSPSKTKTGNRGRGSAKTSKDPISTFSGDFLYDRTDLILGSGAFPYSINFARSYDSGSRLTDGPLGLGWTHNCVTKLSQGSDGLRGCGEVSPKEAAATIAQCYVMLQLNLPVCDLKDFLIASTSTMWLMDQLTNNAVTLNDGGESRTFIKLPYTGTGAPPYNPPPGYADILIDNLDGTFQIVSPQQLKWNFGTDGNLVTYVAPAGVTVSYSYSSGVLQTVSNGLGRTLTFNYTGSRLTSVSDGTGRSVSFTVDSGTGNLTAFTDAAGKTISYAYTTGVPGQMSQLFLPANPSIPFITNTFDSLGRVMTQALAAAGTTIFYFAGSRSEIADPLGNSEVMYFNSLGSMVQDINALGQEMRYVRDGLNRIVSIIYPELNQVNYSFDTKNNMTSQTWIPKPGSPLTNIVQTFEYDFSGYTFNWNKPTKFTDGEGNETGFTYDDTQGTLITITRPVIDSETPIVSFSYNSYGQLVTRTDETGIVDNLVYATSGAKDRLLSITRDYGTGRINLETQFGYDSVGNVNSVTDPRGNATTFGFDNERRLTQRTECSPFSYVTQWAYDDNGNAITVKRQTGDMAHPYQIWSYAYSANNCLLTITDPANNELNFAYNDNNWVVSKTDAEDRIWQYACDQIGRIIIVTDPMGNASQTNTFTANGRLATIADARANVTIMQYDGYDRLSERIYPDATYEQNTYNANSQILTVRTRLGDTITNTFDVLNRPSTRQPGSVLGLQTMTYDLAGRILEVSTPTVSGDPSTGTFQFSYDTAGRLLVQTMPNSHSVTYQLDANGNCTRLIWPDTYYADYVFDQLNRLTDVKLNGSSSSALNFEYDELSRRTQLNYLNGCVCTYGYALNNDLTSLEQAFVGSSVAFGITFNNVHQATEITVSDSEFQWTPSAGSTTVYNPANDLNQYPAVGGTSFGYNDNGCLTSGPQTASFDALNRITQVVSGSTTNNYWTDPMNRQAQKEVGTTKTGFLFDGNQLIAAYNSSGTLTDRFIPGTRLDEILIQISGGTTTYLHQDRLGSVIAQTNSSTGAVLNKYQYSPFGETASLPGTIFGFTGQRYDSEVGLYNYKMRYYAPSVGRFLQPDPIGYSTGMNLYSYVNNDSTNFSDPLGLKSYIGFEGWDYNGIPVNHSGILTTDSNGMITHENSWGPNDVSNNDNSLVRWPSNQVGKNINDQEYYRPVIELKVPKGMTSEEFDQRLINASDAFTREMEAANAQWTAQGKGSNVNCHEGTASVIQRAGGTVPSGPWNVIPAPGEPHRWYAPLIRPFYNPNMGLRNPTLPYPGSGYPASGYSTGPVFAPSSFTVETDY